jgi:hypothetical protein
MKVGQLVSEHGTYYLYLYRVLTLRCFGLFPLNIINENVYTKTCTLISVFYTSQLTTFFCGLNTLLIEEELIHILLCCENGQNKLFQGF